MFLHLSVILFMGGGSLSRGVSVQEDLCLGGLSVQGGSLSRGLSVGLCQGDPLYGKERVIRILLE